MFLAEDFDEKIIWDYIKEEEHCDDVNGLCMELIQTTGCNNKNCSRYPNGSEQYFFQLYNVGYDEINNKFVNLKSINIDRITLDKLNNEGIRPLDYFQIYYCPSCKNIDYYIE